MKKSLNNKIRGKRLVMGDENEVTSHEMLVEDKDGKIIVKQRGADGKMESVSEGESIVNNLYYYMRPSSSDHIKIEYSKITSFKDFFNRGIAKPEGYCYVTLNTVMPAANSSNVSVSYEKYDTSEMVEINVKSPTEELVSPNPLYYMLSKSYTVKDGTIQDIPMKANSVIDDEINPILYNAATNVLIYYTEASDCFVNITPESLAETLKCYVAIGSNHVYLPEGATLIQIG